MVFVDQLSANSLLHIVPRGVARWLLRREKYRFQYFSATKGGKLFSRVFKRLGWFSAEEVQFSYIHVHHSDGSQVGPRVNQIDPLPLCSNASSTVFEPHSLVSRFAARFDRNRVLMYLEKSLSQELTPTLMRLNVVSWLQGREGAYGREQATFFMAKTPWHSMLKEYAQEKGVRLHSYVGPYWPQKPGVATRIFSVVALLSWRLVKSTMARKRPVSAAHRLRTGTNHTVATHFTGFGLTLDQSQNSDLFWVPYANLPPNQLLVYFSRGDDRLDDSKLSYLNQLGASGVAVNRSAAAGESVPIWPDAGDIPGFSRGILSAWKFLMLPLVTSLTAWRISRWISFKLFEFAFDYVYWRWMFSSFNVKLHVDPADHVRHRAASDKAIADLGGVSVGYQRSSDLFASVMRATAADVHFAFAPAWAELARNSRSSIPQLVANGYVHDRAFSLARTKSTQLRDGLQNQGVRFIICFFDESSSDDQRRGATHSFRAENYRFLLDKLFKDPELGLVFKPKKPSTLRRRLGKVSDLLDQALETGRCHLYAEGVAATEVLPCEASLVADVTIGMMSGGTAAMESALAGSRTLILDREFLTFHPLYELGEGRVVFRDWETLWDALTAYREDPRPTSGFGDWSAMLDNLDPFRDGKAAQRMGEYIGWLSQGLTEGLNRDQTMQRAREKYVAAWGEDVVMDLRQAREAQPLETRAPELVK